MWEAKLQRYDKNALEAVPPFCTAIGKSWRRRPIMPLAGRRRRLIPAYWSHSAAGPRIGCNLPPVVACESAVDFSSILDADAPECPRQGAGYNNVLLSYFPGQIE
jgi:hypothetical protein